MASWRGLIRIVGRLTAAILVAAILAGLWLPAPRVGLSCAILAPVLVDDFKRLSVVERLARCGALLTGSAFRAASGSLLAPAGSVL